MLSPAEYNAAREQLVVKANELIQRDRFSLTVQQQKVVLYLISKIKPGDTDFTTVEFDIPEFCQVCGIDFRSGMHYQKLKEAIKDIADKSIYIRLPDRQRETLVRWIEKPYFNEKSGKVLIKIDEDMKPYLLQLKENFTQYELIYTLCFKSQYSLRLYELVKARHYHELQPLVFRVSVDDLRDRLVIVDPQRQDKRRRGNSPDAPKYTEFRDFRARVLVPAVRDINEYSDKAIEFAAIKRGRNTEEIEFTVTTKSPQEIAEIHKMMETKYGDDQITVWDYLRAPSLPEGE